MQSSLSVQKLYNIISIPIHCEYIKLLFSGNSDKGRWICMYYSNNIIHIYDSLNVKCLKGEDKVFINRLFPNNPELKITFETVQSQTNSYNCGIFAIAFAISILFNILLHSHTHTIINNNYYYKRTTCNLFKAINTHD